MTGWSDVHLLEAWEHSAGLDQVARAVSLAASLSDGLHAPVVAAMPIGRRDAILFDARRRVFGARCAAIVRCPACAETVEFEADTETLRPGSALGADHLEVDVDGWHLVTRLPTSSDLLVSISEEASGRDLFARCLISAAQGGVPVDAAGVPDDVLEKVEAEMDHADPGADIELGLRCAACGHAWSEAFDIASFLAAELEAWARATLRQVAGLGRAYGWSEPECLALSPVRRQLYLDLAAS